MSVVARGVAVSPLLSGRAVVLAIQGVRGDAFAEGRAISLLRGIAEYSDVALINLDGMAPETAVAAINDAAQEQGAGLVIVCAAEPGAVGWREIVCPEVIAAPVRVGHGGLTGDRTALDGIRRLWARSAAEADSLRRQFPAAEITIIPDHFDVVAPEPAEKRAAAIALIASTAAPPTAVGDMWAVVSEEADQQVLATPAVYDQLAARGLAGRVIRTGNVAEAIAVAQQVVVHADDPEGCYLAARAAAAECETRFAGGAGVTARQADVARAIGDALGVGPAASDDATTGERLARAIGLKLESDFVYYMPAMQLVHAELLVTAPVPVEALGGYLETRGGERDRLINAWVQGIGTNAPGAYRLRATTAMPPGGRPDGIELTVELWGLPCAKLSIGAEVTEIGAGLISINPISSKRVSVDYWASKQDVTIQFGAKPVTAEPNAVGGNGLASYRVEAAYPFNRDTLTVLTGGAVGRIQRFTALPTYMKDYRPSSLRLAALRDAHVGRTAWLVGNGPSVRTEDLDRLADSDAITFCFNRFHLAHERTRLRANYTVSADQQMIADFGEEILERSGGIVFLADFMAPHLSGDYCWVRQVNVFPSLFSRDPTRFVTPGGSSLYVAMQIGYYMGIRQWYVYGADFEFNLKRDKSSADVWRAATGDNNHFIPGYRSGKAWCPPSIENILPSFLGARQLVELDGGFIRNATRGGRLDVFDRISFEDALAAS